MMILNNCLLLRQYGLLLWGWWLVVRPSGQPCSTPARTRHNARTEGISQLIIGWLLGVAAPVCGNIGMTKNATMTIVSTKVPMELTSWVFSSQVRISCGFALVWGTILCCFTAQLSTQKPDYESGFFYFPLLHESVTIVRSNSSLAFGPSLYSGSFIL